jgi:SAM-dependent methyltransferase
MKTARLYVIACVIAGLLIVGCNQRTPEQKAPDKGTPAKSAVPAKTAESAKPAEAAATKPAETKTANQPPEEELKEIRTPDVIFVPTPIPVVDKMLEMAKVTKDDLLYDLGCGEGAIVIEAAKKIGCHCVGFEIEPGRVRKARANVEANNVGNLVRIEQKDIFTLDLSPANVITLYLLPSLNVKLIPQLEKLKPGSRIVSHDFDMEGVKPDQVVDVEAPTSGYGSSHKVYLWTTPLTKEKPAQP